MVHSKFEEIENIIKKITVSTIKYYKGKGPEYVNVKIEDNLIRIHTKGTSTDVGKVLVKHGEMALVELMREKLCPIIHEILVNEIYDKTKVKCFVLNQEQSILEDYKILVLKIENNC